MVTTKDLITFLKKKNVNSGFIDQLKVHYRPLISPFDELINSLSNSESIFDIGCGSGQLALLIAEFTKAKRIGGIEINETLVANADELLNEYRNRIDINFQIYDGKIIPNIIGDYDVILLIDVLHHVPKEFQIKFLQEIFNKMNMGSHLIIKDINANSPFVFFNKLHDLIFSQEIGNEVKLKSLAFEVNKIGFKILQSSKKQLYVYPHYTLILEK
jgi:2-polyprenyl-3-methyl-5-hydroxy-6-metoxy-1,4-benzoquinol methylase